MDPVLRDKQISLEARAPSREAEAVDAQSALGSPPRLLSWAKMQVRVCWQRMARPSYPLCLPASQAHIWRAYSTQHQKKTPNKQTKNRNEGVGNWRRRWVKFPAVQKTVVTSSHPALSRTETNFWMASSRTVWVLSDLLEKKSQAHSSLLFKLSSTLDLNLIFFKYKFFYGSLTSYICGFSQALLL